MNDRCKKYCGFVSSPVGTRLRARFRKDCRENPPKLVKIGETNQYEIIQSYKDSCDISKLVARAAAGDISVLQRVQGIYSDISNVPQTMTELMNLGVLSAAAWDLLNPDIKAKFENEEAFKDALLSGNLSAFSSTVEDIHSDPVEGGAQ